MAHKFNLCIYDCVAVIVHRVYWSCDTFALGGMGGGCSQALDVFWRITGTSSKSTLLGSLPECNKWLIHGAL